MTLIELQEILGNTVKAVVASRELPRATQEREQENAEYVAKLAKQMINNADVILRIDKLTAEGKSAPNASKLVK